MFNLRIGKILLFALLFTFLLLTGCGTTDDPVVEDGDSCPHFYCPTTGELVTWDNYGKLEIDNLGSDSCARKLISKCDWHVYQGHNGGWGDTLEIATPNEGVIFVWSWNNFASFNVGAGWTGSTPEGIRLGSTLEEFLAAYPDFFALDFTHTEYELYNSSTREHSYVSAVFEDEVLVELSVY